MNFFSSLIYYSSFEKYDTSFSYFFLPFKSFILTIPIEVKIYKKRHFDLVHTRFLLNQIKSRISVFSSYIERATNLTRSSILTFKSYTF